MANEQAVGAGEGALSGAAAGAALGSFVPVIGTAVGAAGGAIIGGAMGYLGSSSKGYSLPWDQYYARLAQINSYKGQLSAATNAYASAVSNMYNTAFNQYLPNAEAAFAGRGLSVDSGAFGSELAKVSAMNTASMTADIGKQRIDNVNKINSQYGDAWSAMFGASARSNEAGFNNANANMAGLGSAAVGLGKLAMVNRGNGVPPQNPWGTPQAYGADGGATPTNWFRMPDDTGGLVG